MYTSVTGSKKIKNHIQISVVLNIRPIGGFDYIGQAAVNFHESII